MRRLAALCLGVLLAACGQQADPATPALYKAACPGGGEGWLFGTVHALERPAQWRSERIDSALKSSDLLMVEVAGLDDPDAGASVYAKLARSPGQGSLIARVSPPYRDGLRKVLATSSIPDDRFADVETWAAAITIAQAARPALDSGNGIDRAVLKAARDTPVEELEGYTGQLGIFDRLDEADQRQMLEAIVDEAQRDEAHDTDLAAAWRKGDMAAIAAETKRGMLADPELREALFTGRNRRWTQRILAAMTNGSTPFVAVGAAHMAGPDGLPAMLQARDCKITRAQ